jgi:hypothetical protein
MVRKAVPQETQVEVLAACRRRCAICFGLNRDTGIKPGQIAHLDRDAANPSLDNLVFLCLEHHDQFDSRTSQSKGLTSDEVRRFRQELATAIEHEYHPPTPDIISDRATPALAPQRATIREKSATEILGYLKGIMPSYGFHEAVEAVYLGRWTQEPGWQATVCDLPSKLPGGIWHCMLKEVGSGTVVTATTVQDVSMLRQGDLVTVSGRIRGVRQGYLESVSLEDAIVRGDNVPFPESRGLPR